MESRGIGGGVPRGQPSKSLLRELTRRSIISDPEKASIREGLLKAAIVEHDSKMAVLAAVVISRIARADFPTKWFVLDFI
jgi:hypothetical protein